MGHEGKRVALKRSHTKLKISIPDKIGKRWSRCGESLRSDSAHLCLGASQANVFVYSISRRDFWFFTSNKRKELHDSVCSGFDIAHLLEHLVNNLDDR